MLGVHLRTWPGVLSDTSLAVIMHAERGGLPPPSWLCRRRSAARRGVPAELCSNNAIAVRICATVTYAFCTDHSNMKAWVRFTTRRTMSAVKSKFQNTFCCYYHYQVLGYFWTSRPISGLAYRCGFARHISRSRTVCLAKTACRFIDRGVRSTHMKIWPFYRQTSPYHTSQ